MGWSDYATYTFTIETSPTRVRVLVDGTLELDVTGEFGFGGGRFGFYNNSQADVTYSAFSARGLGLLEGEVAELRLPIAYATGLVSGFLREANSVSSNQLGDEFAIFRGEPRCVGPARSERR